MKPLFLYGELILGWTMENTLLPNIKRQKNLRLIHFKGKRFPITRLIQPRVVLNVHELYAFEQCMFILTFIRGEPNSGFLNSFNKIQTTRKRVVFLQEPSRCKPWQKIG